MSELFSPVFIRFNFCISCGVEGERDDPFGQQLVRLLVSCGFVFFFEGRARSQLDFSSKMCLSILY